MKKLFGKMGAMLLALIIAVSMFSTAAFAATTSLPDNTTERVLDLYKYAPTTGSTERGDGTVDPDASTDKEPLENVEFEIYKVPDGQATSTTPTSEELAAIKVEGNLIATVKTDATGHASYSFGTGRTNDGKYLVVEKDNAAVEVKADPFYLNIPLTNPAGDGWLYTVTVYPKNDIVTGPEVEKDVTTVGNNHDSFDIGDTQTWIIRGDVPSDLYQVAANGTEIFAKNYSFTDNIDSRLDYKANVIVKLYDKESNETVLDPAHYTVDYTAGTVIDSVTYTGTLKVSLTEAGMKYIQQTLDADTVNVGKPEIRVYFDTVINDTAELATNIPNDVTLDYTNSTGHQYDPATVPTEEIPEVHMGGLVIDKYKKGETATKLEGAVFKIARDATADEIADDSVVKETITVNGEDKTVVFVDFYDTDAIDGERVTEVTTDANGKAVVNGLAYGNYYLVETKAPEGYNLLTSPITVTINESSHITENAVTVENSAKFILPITGGTGTMLFTMSGILLIGLAIILIVSSKKKKVAAK